MHNNASFNVSKSWSIHPRVKVLIDPPIKAAPRNKAFSVYPSRIAMTLGVVTLTIMAALMLMKVSPTAKAKKSHKIAAVKLSTKYITKNSGITTKVVTLPGSHQHTIGRTLGLACSCLSV